MDALWTHLPRALAPAVDRLTGHPFLWRLAHGERRLHLTFDDGPDPATTPALLDLLARHDVRATFFFLGNQATRYGGLVRAALDAGHAVGQHTHTHVDAWKVLPARLFAELAAGTRAVEDAAGRAVRWMRFPYGRVTPHGAGWVAAHGQRGVMWDVMPGDFIAGSTAASVVRRVERLMRPGSVVVLHEGGRGGPIALEALRGALGRWRADGWAFDTLGDAC